MKKVTLILTLAVFVFSCAKKTAPTASAGSSPAGNSGKVVSGGAPAAASSSPASASTPAVLPSENTGSKTPATPATNASPEVMGQSTYNAKCGKCHGLKPTTDYTAERWVSIVQVMAPKARLTDAEKDNVLAYVKANAKK
ncbi:MAG: cytochrome c [Ferruginibacter sp.]